MKQLPRPLKLADLPTPVEKMSNLGRHLGHDSLYVKRDDLSSGLYGGNKVRKLEFLLAEALDQSSPTLVTMGGIGSNHLLATALHGRAQGLRTVGVVFPQPITEHVRRNLAAFKGAGVELVFLPHKYALPAGVAWTLARLTLREGRRPLLIPGGGSSPLGALGFVYAGLELAEQVRDGLLPEPRKIFLPYGTGGTAVGLALGLQLAGLNSQVVAVRVIDRLLANRPRMLIFAKAVKWLLARRGIQVPGQAGTNLQIDHGQIGPGYGYGTAAAEQARLLLEAQEGLETETTYTAKAAAAFIDEARRTKLPMLLWHTLNSADIESWVAAGRRKERGA
ncbi:MAG: pyridoxal-phosphate dependent enzyme [Deltaproteobacteria bacterium]|nr:pyridoxal-phosphate dependent enzyme [Deltaproteobacteria bacterium]